MIEPKEMTKVANELFTDSFVFTSLQKDLKGLIFFHFMIPKEFYEALRLRDINQDNILIGRETEKIYVFFKGNSKV